MATLAPYYAALLVGILVAGSGQLLIKVGAVRNPDAAAQFFDRFTILGVAAYGISAMLYLVAIRRIPLSQAYPTVAINYAIIAVAAHYFWGERLGWSQIAGIVLILGGIVLLHRS
jgi:small multidrug resistance pump